MSDHERIARQLFNAFETGDGEAARALLSEDFRGSQNGGPEMDGATLLAFSGAVHARVEEFRYEEITCRATETGFVEEHAVRGTLPGGEELDITLCVVGDIEGGVVTRLREYLDSAKAAGLAKALAG